jgi:formate hydrogenlyase subunit 3/multisubunit Na+/H+ antiporter MnhD subunit
MDFYVIVTWTGAILLMVGEVLALLNVRNVRRALLYATGAEFGYVLMGLGLRSATGWTGAAMHLGYQVVMRGLVFLVLAMLIRKAGSSRLDRLAGVWQREPMLALLFGFGLFSVMGLSPFKGSFSRFLILYAAVDAGHWLLASVGTVASMIAAGYNVYIIQRICFERSASGETKGERKWFAYSPAMLLAWGLTALTIYMSLFPRPLLALAERFSGGQTGTVPDYEVPWSFLILLPYLGGFVVFALGCVNAKLRDVGAVALAGLTVAAVFRQTGLDSLSWLAAMVFAVVCFAVVLYSTSYMAGKEHANRYYFLLFLMLGSLLGVATERQLGNFYLFWELMTWTSYLLVIHDQTQEALKAGMKYFVMCTSGAYVMHLGILLLHSRLHTFDMAVLASRSGELTPWVSTAILSLFMVGFAVKAALFPLHSWLPDAHPVAPASISAPMSAIVTKAGVFGLIKILFVMFSASALACWSFAGWTNPLGLVLSTAGAITLLLGEVMAYRQTELKRMLAYSTLAQVGEIVAVLGLGTYLSVAGSMFHLLNHAAMKSMLFLAAGALIFRSGRHSISDLKGIGRVMPWTSACFSIGALSIVGLPPFGGFFSKFLMVYACVQSGHVLLAALLLLGGVIAAMYYGRVVRVLFFEAYDGPPLKEAPATMLASIAGLTAPILLCGVFPNYVIGLVRPIAAMVAVRGGLVVVPIPSLQMLWPACAVIAAMGAVLAYVAGKRSARAAGVIAVSSMAIALSAILLRSERFDLLSFWFATLIATVGGINLLYSLGYLRYSHAHGRYYFLFVSMIGGLLGMACSNDVFSFFAFWEIMSSWTLYFLIIHEETAEAIREGTKYFVFNVIGASLIFLGIVVLSVQSGSFKFSVIAESARQMQTGWLALAMITIFAGLLMKTAMLPVRIDIQMHPATAPTPVSGYISAVLLESGIYGILKFTALMGGSVVLYRLGKITSLDSLQYGVAAIAAVTTLYAGAMAVIQNGVKRLLIYSTVSQLGYMLLGVSLGSALGVAGGLMHLVNHMLLKDTLFLCAGCILAQGHVRSLDELGGLARRMPITFAIFLFSGLSLAGIPPLNGFSSKWLIYEAALESGHYWMALAMLVSSLFTLAAILKFAHAAFMGAASKATENMTDPPASMLGAMLALTGASAAVSVFPGILLVPISHIQQALGLPAVEASWTGALPGPHPWHPATLMAMFGALAFAGWIYSRLANRTVVRTHLYTCGALDVNLAGARVNASNLYESPDELLRRISSRASEEVEHA